MSGLAPWAVAALAPYAVAQIAFLRRLAKAPEVIGGSMETVGRARWRRHVARRAAGSAFGAVFWALCVLAASGSVRVPRYATQTVTGAELAFVIDASNSMLSADGGPSRLERAREFVSRAAAAADGAGLSVVAFVITSYSIHYTKLYDGLSASSIAAPTSDPAELVTRNNFV